MLRSMGAKIKSLKTAAKKNLRASSSSAKKPRPVSGKKTPRLKKVLDVRPPKPSVKKSSGPSLRGSSAKLSKARNRNRKFEDIDVVKDEELKQILKQEPVLEAPQERRKNRRSVDEGAEAAAAENESEQTLDRTPMKIYLTQIEAIPLLTPEQEIELAQKVHGRDQEIAEKARHQMIRSNLRLVISIAKRYSNMGLAFSDLVEEGNIGLMRAVEKFNPDRGYRFSTYASWWIKQSIMRSLSNQGKTIRVPVYMYDIISKWRKVRDGLMQKLSRMPTAKEIAEKMKVSVHKIEEIEKIAGRPSSLNAPISLDGTAELVDILPDDASHSPEAIMEEVLKNSRIQQFLKQLDERESRILVQRFGLGKDDPQTLEEVA